MPWQQSLMRCYSSILMGSTKNSPVPGSSNKSGYRVFLYHRDPVGSCGNSCYHSNHENGNDCCGPGLPCSSTCCQPAGWWGGMDTLATAGGFDPCQRSACGSCTAASKSYRRCYRSSTRSTTFRTRSPGPTTVDGSERSAKLHQVYRTRSQSHPHCLRRRQRSNRTRLRG